MVKQTLDTSGSLYQYDNYDEVAMDTDSETNSPGTEVMSNICCEIDVSCDVILDECDCFQPPHRLVMCSPAFLWSPHLSDRYSDSLACVLLVYSS